MTDNEARLLTQVADMTEEMDNLIFGKTWDEIQAMQQRTYRPKTINTNINSDYGADPIGNGMYKMVPSGDIVDFAERCNRLNK